MDVARRVRPFEKFWLPWSLDWRGRMYPIPDYLSPQGNDFQRSLFQFAEGKPLGRSGAYWLAVTGANLMGTHPDIPFKLSSVHYDDRVRWVEANEKLIRATASDPWETLEWWTKAESPLQFFAWCCEWVGYLTEGETYVCGLPCAMDGSANGIQHYSAMLQDVEGARLTNMYRSFAPEDLYRELADDVKQKLTFSDDPMAKLWLDSGLVTRNLVKRPTMTMPYSATRWGFQDQLLDYLRSGELTERLGANEGELHKAVRFIVRVINAALSERAGAAIRGMDYLRAIGSIVCGNTRKPLSWVSPTGFPVIQRYFHIERYRIRTILAGNVYKTSAYTETEEPNIRKQANGIAPNLIHSLDAAALARTILAAKQAGVSSFGSVHDSYVTVPADVEKLQTHTRQQFARIYLEKDVIADFRDQLQAACTGNKVLPEPPEKGDYDVRNVISATYFFS
jgi:DNA-directed RNA polymerase